MDSFISFVSTFTIKYSTISMNNSVILIGLCANYQPTVIYQASQAVASCEGYHSNIILFEFERNQVKFRLVILKWIRMANNGCLHVRLGSIQRNQAFCP